MISTGKKGGVYTSTVKMGTAGARVLGIVALGALSCLLAAVCGGAGSVELLPHPWGPPEATLPLSLADAPQGAKGPAYPPRERPDTPVRSRGGARQRASGGRGR